MNIKKKNEIEMINFDVIKLKIKNERKWKIIKRFILKLKTACKYTIKKLQRKKKRWTILSKGNRQLLKILKIRLEIFESRHNTKQEDFMET